MLDGSIILAAYLTACGSILLMVFGMGRLVDLHLSTGAALALDALLSLAFFVQHSVMVRRPVKARLARHLPARYLGAIYAIASGIVLGATAILWQGTGAWFTATGPLRWASVALSLLGVAGLAWGGASLRGFDPLGLRPIRAHRRARPVHPMPMQVRGAYRWVRHPLYLSVLLLLWSNPEPSADRLLLAALWTAWVVGATFLEERDLVAELGPPYQAYQRRVPMLFPWRRPAAPDLGAASS